MRLKRIDPVSLAIMFGFLNAVGGLIAGLMMFAFMTMAAGIGGSAMHDSDFPRAFSAIFGVGFVIAAPFLYGIMGFIVGLIGGWLYNLAAGWFGGVKIELEWPEQQQQPAAPTA